MSRPRIGITTSYEDGTQRVDHNYVQAVEDAGGLPVVVPMFRTQDAADQFSGLLDGLVITGGPGITTNMIGDLPDDLTPVDPMRAQSDQYIYNTFRDARPVMGICYGMQFINAQAGGAIYGDLAQHIKTHIQHSPKRGGTEHPVTIDASSHLRTLLGHEVTANTYHIQSVASIGDGLRAVAHGPDGVVEAIESDDGRLMGLQFHPERMMHITAPLFEHFVERAAHG